MTARTVTSGIAVLLVALCSCAAPSSLGPARSGDLPALRAAIAQDVAEGRLTRESLVDVAVALASNEIRSAKGPAASQRIAQLKACARHLEPPLLERAGAREAVGADAAMALLLARRGDPEAWRRHVSSADPAWRSVGARTLTAPIDGATRRALVVDPDENVRLAAARASDDARDPADAGLLFEAARLDPSPLVRVAAVRALAAVGGADTALRLKDLWPHAPEPVRQAIVGAWAFPGLLEAGGRRELLLVAETAQGTAAILAGGILFRLGGEVRGAGAAALAKALEQGLARDRALAIHMTPLDDSHVREAVKKAAASREPEVQVAALGRLAREPSERAKALEALGGLAASSLPVAARAKEAMARLGDARVTALLVRDTLSREAATRFAAARGLVELGDLARAALLLADPEPDVRTRLSCEILLASERW
jgi:hypothetical protein